MADEIRAPQRPISPPQRVTTSLLERKWGSLLVELILIVSGILIALYIDGWVQDRQDRESEATYLALLQDDLALIEDMLEEYVRFETDNATTARDVYVAVSGEVVSAAPDDIRDMLSQLASRRTLRIVSAAYTDLTSTGNIQLIRNQALRNAILRHFATIERAEAIIEKNNSAIIDAIYYPFMLDTEITPVWRSSLIPDIAVANERMMELLGPERTYPRDDVLTRPAGSRSWDDIRRHILLRMRVASVGAIIGERMIEETRVLYQDIETELARRDSAQ